MVKKQIIKSFVGSRGGFSKEPLAAGGTMLVHPFARPGGLPSFQTASQTLRRCTCHVPAGGIGRKPYKKSKSIIYAGMISLIVYLLWFFLSPHRSLLFSEKMVKAAGIMERAVLIIGEYCDKSEIKIDTTLDPKLLKTTWRGTTTLNNGTFTMGDLTPAADGGGDPPSRAGRERCPPRRPRSGS